MNAMQTNDRRLVHARTPWAEMLGWPLFHMATEAAAVNIACTNVPETSQSRVDEPILSPIRPKEAPVLKAMSDISAC